MFFISKWRRKWFSSVFLTFKFRLRFRIFKAGRFLARLWNCATTCPPFFSFSASRNGAQLAQNRFGYFKARLRSSLISAHERRVFGLRFAKHRFGQVRARVRHLQIILQPWKAQTDRHFDLRPPDLPRMRPKTAKKALPFLLARISPTTLCCYFLMLKIQLIVILLLIFLNLFLRFNLPIQNLTLFFV